MSDGMSDGYRMEEEGREQRQRETADDDYDSTMEDCLHQLRRMIGTYGDQRERSLGSYTHDGDRPAHKERLAELGRKLADKMMAAAEKLRAKR